MSAWRDGELLVFVEGAVAIFQRGQKLKLASLGRLTASIAHEIRNPLSAVNQAIQLLAEGSELAPAETRFTEIIRSNALRVDEIVESVLQLSRRAPSEPSVFEGGPWLKQFVPEVYTDFVHVPVAVITAHVNVETAVGALKAGAFDFVSKPLDLGDLRALITAALRTVGTSAPSTARNRTLIASSPAIVAMREQIGCVARSQAPVYISGESGTGKELVACMIHDRRGRSAGPFVPVNCGAISPDLIE